MQLTPRRRESVSLAELGVLDGPVEDNVGVDTVADDDGVFTLVDPLFAFDSLGVTDSAFLPVFAPVSALLPGTAGFSAAVVPPCRLRRIRLSPS